MEEIWKTVASLPKYEVNREGQIRNKKSGRLRVLVVAKTGYVRLNLCTNGSGRKSAPVHRLVAIAFIPNPNNYPQVNHINGDKLDNRVENLEWATPSENTQHAYRLGLSNGKKGEIHSQAKLTNEDVLKIKELRKNKSTRAEVASLFNISINHVTRITKGTRWAHQK